MIQFFLSFFFFLKIIGHLSVLRATDASCGLQSQSNKDWYALPEIHLWRYTYQPLGSQQGGWPSSSHTVARRGKQWRAQTHDLSCVRGACYGQWYYSNIEAGVATCFWGSKYGAPRFDKKANSRANIARTLASHKHIHTYLEISVHHVLVVTVLYSLDDLPEHLARLGLLKPAVFRYVFCNDIKIKPWLFQIKPHPIKPW